VSIHKSLWTFQNLLVHWGHQNSANGVAFSGRLSFPRSRTEAGLKDWVPRSTLIPFRGIFLDCCEKLQVWLLGNVPGWPSCSCVTDRLLPLGVQRSRWGRQSPVLDYHILWGREGGCHLSYHVPHSTLYTTSVLYMSTKPGWDVLNGICFTFHGTMEWCWRLAIAQ
jgi:hypothetical protein